MRASREQKPCRTLVSGLLALAAACVSSRSGQREAPVPDPVSIPVVEATLATGARDAHLIEEPLAAAIGAGLPVDEAVGSLVLDVGGYYKNVVTLAPSLHITAEEIDLGLALFDQVLQRAKRELSGLPGRA